MSRLTARVKAVNNVNAYAGIVYDKLIKVFTPFVGQKIEKVDGTLLAKIEKLLPEFPRSTKLSVYKYSSNYSLVWMVKACESFDGIASYHETGVYIGNMRDGVLTALCNRPELRSDYTEQEIIAKRALYEAALKVMEDARSELHPFGEYDR